MIRTPVTSSALVSIGYESGVIEAEFKGGRVYRYADVEPDVYAQLLAPAPEGDTVSLGRRFQALIKGGGYAVERVEEAKAEDGAETSEVPE